MTFRAAGRGVVLLFALLLCALRFAWMSATGVVTPAARARWMQFCGRIVMAALGIQARVEGPLPRGTTLLVANHLSYLDIVIGSAVFPCAFVAKDEIAAWPFFGLLARLGGTIFLDRTSRLSAWDAAESIGLRLDQGVPVLFFPEGTSTDGSEVIRFHSTLFQPAIESGIPITPAAIFYEPSGTTTERDLCWYGDETFLPHLLRVLAVPRFTAVVRFGMPESYPDRRTAAWRTHDAIELMRMLASTKDESFSHAYRS